MSGQSYNDRAQVGKPDIYSTARPAGQGTRSIVHSRRRAARPFDFGECDAEELQHFVRTVAEHGDCCCFTTTSDGGALCTTVVQATVRHKVYGSTPSDCYVAWHDLLEALY